MSTIGVDSYLVHAYVIKARLVLYYLEPVHFYETQLLMRKKWYNKYTLITGKEGNVFLTQGIA